VIYIIRQSTKVYKKKGEKRLINIPKLKGKIIEKYGSQGKFVKELDISQQSWIERLKGTRDFKYHDIEQIISLLGLTDAEVRDIFFN
jgi:hypothetical protein